MKTGRPTCGLFLSDVLEWTQVIEITKVQTRIKIAKNLKLVQC